MTYTTTCITCNIEFSMPVALKMKRLKDGQSFYCPRGHPMIFTDSENARLKDQVAELQRENRNLAKSAKDWRDTWKRLHEMWTDTYDQLKLARRQKGYYHGRYKMLKAQLAGDEEE